MPRSLGQRLSIDLPVLHQGQIKVAAEAQRFNVLDCGRRWGKSLFMRDRAIETMLTGRPVGWFSPINKILADSWREVKSVLAPVTPDGGKSEEEHRIQIVGGGVIEMWSLESQDAGRSRKYARVIVDEAAMAPSLKRSWEENIRPTLSDFRGDAWIGSTPKGINEFKNMFDRGTNPLRPSWMSWQMPTTSNPHISPEEIEEARQDMTEASFNQEYLAMFVNWEGSAFRNIEACIDGVELEGPIEGHDYVIGGDWGRSRDYTVFVVLDVTDNRLVKMDRSNKVDYSIQRDRLRVLRDRWHPKVIVVEENSIGGPIIEQLIAEGITVEPFQTSNSSKGGAVDALALAFERTNIRIPNNPILISELVAFQGTILPSGLIRYAAPEGGHDDCVMALIMAWTKVSGRLMYGALTYNSGEERRVQALKRGIQEAARKRSISSVVGGKTCPKCGSTAVSSSGGHDHCNQCGEEFGFGKGMIIDVPTRSNYLARMGGR